MLRIIGPLRMQERVESKEGKKMIGRRMSTVEPVFGSLLNYYGMKRSNTKGKQAAHKFMLMSATAYNLQKLLSCFTHPKSNVQILTQKQVHILYFVLRYVVQQPDPFLETHNCTSFLSAICPKNREPYMPRDFLSFYFYEFNILIIYFTYNLW
ncbi:transposase [Rhodocytophaga rosea]|uniref:Transposase n=1 Tax=Rhodocytophaga rosea TaxID=2704465 RepID=A0A6C0GEM4_9BACT|nr:transposase [Rhodocytophaga rosea]QHT66192.1 transposase [Rhodocytophaga rosea]